MMIETAKKKQSSFDRLKKKYFPKLVEEERAHNHKDIEVLLGLKKESWCTKNSNFNLLK